MHRNSQYFSRGREMRCLRHKIHMGLFCAFGLSALNWIFTKSIQSGAASGEQTLLNLIFLFPFQIYRHIWRCLCLTTFTAQVGCSHFSSISRRSTGCLLRVKLSLTTHHKSAKKSEKKSFCDGTDVSFYLFATATKCNSWACRLAFN